MAISRTDPQTARVLFLTTGYAVFVFWNVSTLVGALGAESIHVTPPLPAGLPILVVATATILAGLRLARLRRTR